MYLKLQDQLENLFTLNLNKWQKVHLRQVQNFHLEKEKKELRKNHLTNTIRDPKIIKDKEDNFNPNFSWGFFISNIFLTFV